LAAIVQKAFTGSVNTTSTSFKVLKGANCGDWYRFASCRRYGINTKTLTRLKKSGFDLALAEAQATRLAIL
jgi:hypothetical protein